MKGALWLVMNSFVSETSMFKIEQFLILINGTYTEAGRPTFILLRPFIKAFFLSEGNAWRIISTERSVSAFTKVGVLKNAAIYSEPLFLAG
jgi:hypothetical protein